LLLLLLVPKPMAETAVFYLAGLLLIVVGIPHGANDLLYRADKTMRGAVRFLLLYIGSMLLYGLLWYFLPQLALAIFLLISIHHFGQSNFENKDFRSLPSLLWGGLLLLAPVAFHTSEALSIFGEMTGTRYAANSTWWLLALGTLSAVYLLVALLRYPVLWWQLLLQWALVMLWLAFAPLLSGFIVVFGLWHSAQSLQYQWAYFMGHAQNIRHKPRFFVLNMTLYTILAGAFLFGISFFLPIETALLFVLLSIITLPHAVVMDGIYRR